MCFMGLWCLEHGDIVCFLTCTRRGCEASQGVRVWSSWGGGGRKGSSVDLVIDDVVTRRMTTGKRQLCELFVR